MKRQITAAILYASLLVASFATLTDWRIRLATVAVILMFAARTLWQPRREGDPKPWGRAADVGEAKVDGHGPM